MHIVRGDGGGLIRLHQEARLTHDELFDALMRLADCWQKKWDRRRSLEWKITFGIWALAIAAFFYVGDGGIIPLVLPALVLLAQAYVIVQIRLNNEEDGRVVLQLRREAEALAHRLQILPDVAAPTGVVGRVVQALFHYSVVTQVIPTAIAAAILTQKLWDAPTL